MKLDKDKCLGGRLNNQTVTGIRLNGYTIFPIFELSDVYNTYELYYGESSTGNYTASVVEKDCAIDYELRTDWGDGTINDESTHTYAEPGEYTIRSNGFLNMETDNGSRQLISTPYIRPDVIDGSYLFYNYKNLEVAGMNHPSFDGLSINTSLMNNMSYMFYNCIGIESETADDGFDLSGFNTSKVTDMSYMFYGCENMYEIIGIEDWDTSRVTNMNHMFYNCDNILGLSLMNWNTNRAIDMSYMFYSCNRIQYINLSNFDMTNVTSTENMFSGCANLQTLRLDNCNENTVRKIIESNSLPTSEGFGERTMFINPNYVNVDNLTLPTTWIFEYVSDETPEEGSYVPGEFEYEDITEVTTIVNSSHTDLSRMFYNCENLETIHNIDTWDTSHVTNMSYMFYDCYSLTSLDLSSFNTSKVTDMCYMFCNCDGLTSLDLRNFDMSNVSNTTYMFTNCDNLRELRLDNCSKDTISKIINSSNFPTSVTNDGQNRYIYCKRAEASGLTLPSYFWNFKYVD